MALAEIFADIEIYERPLSKDDILYIPNIKDIEFFNNLVNKISNIILEKKKLTNCENQNTLAMPQEDYNLLKEAIKSDKKWNVLFKDLIKFSGLACDVKEAVMGLSLPTWNEVVADIKHSYKKSNSIKNKLIINFQPTHSYISLLLRSSIIPEFKFNPVVTSGILYNNKSIVIGIRSGKAFGNRYMILPSGTIDLSSANKDLLFDTINKEMVEETSIHPEEINNKGIIARVQDHYTLKLSCFIFGLESKLNNKEIYKRWKESEDALEHNELIFIPNTPDGLKDFLFNSTNNGPNKGTLPVAVAALMAFGYNKFGRRWYDETSLKLNYKFKLILH